MENLPQTNMAELLISLVCLALLVPVKEVNMRCRQRLRTPIPVEILTVGTILKLFKLSFVHHVSHEVSFYPASGDHGNRSGIRFLIGLLL